MLSRVSLFACLSRCDRSRVGRIIRGRIRYSWTLALLALGLTIGPEWAFAHGRSLSYSNWHFTQPAGETVSVSVRLPLLELSRLPIALPLEAMSRGQSGPDDVGRYLARHLTLESPSGPCEITESPRARPTDEGWALYRWKLSCPASPETTIRSRILLDVAPSHLHFARVTLGAAERSGRGRIVERVLSEADQQWTLRTADAADPRVGDASDQQGSSFADYLLLGISHILSGWDHLAFVLALVLLAARLGEVARLITGFTLAHSLTLALAVLGWVHPQSGPVEAVIGFSVALIAAENGWMLAGRRAVVPAIALAGLLALAAMAFAGVGQLTPLTLIGLAVFCFCHFGLLRRSASPNLHRSALAFAFGLVHGFGFAGVLADMTLPTSRLAPALLGFNIGVEIGQLGVVAMIWPLLVLLRRASGGILYRPVSTLR